MDIKLRNPKSGRFTKIKAKKTMKAFDNFGQSMVLKGKKILASKNKKMSGTLIDSYHYKFVPVKNNQGMELRFGFGQASSYWKYIDEGVKGVGGYTGSGRARGGNSPYSFKYDNPKGKLVEALESWIRYKGIPLAQNMTPTSLAFAMGYSIKRRGLERTLFFTKPLEAMYNKMTKQVTKAYADEVDECIKKMDTIIADIKGDISKL
jgi:hypothetical protein